MTTTGRFLVMAAAASLAAGAAAPAFAKSCVRAGGQGSGFTPELATFMANAALKNSITAYGGAAAGKVSVSCKTDMLITNCTARQRVCK